MSPPASPAPPRRLSTPYLIATVLVVLAFFAMIAEQRHDLAWRAARDAVFDSIVPIPAAGLDPRHDGRLVHVTGHVTGASLEDPDTGQRAEGLRLVRTVEMRQWMNVSTSGPGEPQFRQVWLAFAYPNSVLPESARAAGRTNPPMPLASHTVLAGTVSIGALPLDPALARDLPPLRRQNLPPGDLGSLSARLGRPLYAAGNLVTTTAPGAEPAIGDLRLHTRVEDTGPTPVSLLARQENGRLLPLGANEAQLVTSTVRAGAHDLDAFTSEPAMIGQDWAWPIRTMALAVMGLGCFAVIYRGADLSGSDDETAATILFAQALLVALPIWGLALGASLVIASSNAMTGIAATLGTAAILGAAWLWTRRGPA